MSAVNRMAEVYAALPGFEGESFTVQDMRDRIGVPNLSNSTLARLVRQGYLDCVKTPGLPTVYTVRGC